MSNADKSSAAPDPERTTPRQPAQGSAPAPTPAAPSNKPPPELTARESLAQPSGAPGPGRPLFPRLRRWCALGLGTLAALTAAFYLEENWRGASAWETAKTKLESLQEKLDWAAYIPPAAPDDQNFFKAPQMQDWFAGKGSNELTARLSLDTFPALASYRTNGNASVIVTELILRSPGTGEAPPGAAVPPAEVVPVISLDTASLSEAIQQLAKQANLKVDMDPQVISGRPGTDGKPGPPVRVTGQWTNVTALSVLMTLMCDNDLRWVEDAKTGLPLIRKADGAGPPGGVESANRGYVLVMIREAIGLVGEIADRFPLSGNDLRQNPPLRLSIAPDSVPTRSQLALFSPGAPGFRVEPAGNSLRVILNLVPVAAADYLAWSDQFSPEFDKIRQAVKRPAARLDGDYAQLYRAPAPNLTAIDTVASRLASRAKACLMRGQPEEALRELTLLHDLRGCLEGKPAGKLMTLAGAMADAAISGLYAETADYGLRLQVWSDADLAALQEQLGGMDLVGPVWSAMESERAGNCRLLETGTRAEAARACGISAGATHFWRQIASPSALALKFMPRGWVCQNMARLAVLDQKMIDSVDCLQGMIRPHEVDDADRQINQDLLLHHRSFSWFLAKRMIPAMRARLMTTALAQTAVNQALVVCALERCRLATGSYPAALRDLAPQFIRLLPSDPVNGQPFKYRLTAPGRFLLYSIGWDEKDDNGAPLDAEGKGDWVWGRL